MIIRRISIPDEVEVAFKNGERLSFTSVAVAVGKKSGDCMRGFSVDGHTAELDPFGKP